VVSYSYVGDGVAVVSLQAFARLAHCKRDDVGAHGRVVEAGEHGVCALANLGIGAAAVELASEGRQYLREP
jgi:hypothetical protein